MDLANAPGTNGKRQEVSDANIRYRRGVLCAFAYGARA